MLRLAAMASVVTEEQFRRIQRGFPGTGRLPCPGLALEASRLTHGFHPRLMASDTVSPPSPQELFLRMLILLMASKPEDSSDAPQQRVESQGEACTPRPRRAPLVEDTVWPELTDPSPDGR